MHVCSISMAIIACVTSGYARTESFAPLAIGFYMSTNINQRLFLYTYDRPLRSGAAPDLGRCRTLTRDGDA